jgi:hypothetical protein
MTVRFPVAWNLREFLAADLDGNLIRVFYDFTSDIHAAAPASFN